MSLSNGPSRKAIVGWTLAMLAALALAWFVGAVVVPVMQVGAATERVRKSRGPLLAMAEEIISLGGSEVAVRKISLYIALPDGLAPHRSTATKMLGLCGNPAGARLVELATDRDMAVRVAAVKALGSGDIDDNSAIPALERALDDEALTVRDSAAEALKHIRELQKMKSDRK